MAEGALHVQRVVDELLVTVSCDEADVEIVVSLGIPGGVLELLEAVAAECGGLISWTQPDPA